MYFTYLFKAHITLAGGDSASYNTDSHNFNPFVIYIKVIISYFKVIISYLKYKKKYINTGNRENIHVKNKIKEKI